MQQINNLFSNHTLSASPEVRERRIRNNKDLVREEIWDIIRGLDPKKNRKMFMIKTSKVPTYKLLQFRKEAEGTGEFVRSFYGRIKGYNRELEGLDKFSK